MNNYFQRVLSSPIQLEDDALNKAVGVDQNNWTPELNEKQLFEIFNKGASLNIYLRPSNNIKRRNGTDTYIENYALPLIFREDKYYISMSSGHHVDDGSYAQVVGGARSYYSYSNCGAGFMNYVVDFSKDSSDSTVLLMNKVRYEEMEWIVRDSHELIFEGESFKENPDIVKAIRAGKDFRIALTLPDGRQFRMDIDLLFYHLESRRTQGYTKTHFYPAFCGSPKLFHEHCVEQLLNKDGVFEPEMINRVEDIANPTLFWVYDDGTFSNAFMKRRNEVEKFKDIKIFASRN